MGRVEEGGRGTEGEGEGERVVGGRWVVEVVVVVGSSRRLLVELGIPSPPGHHPIRQPCELPSPPLPSTPLGRSTVERSSLRPAGLPPSPP